MKKIITISFVFLISFQSVLFGDWRSDANARIEQYRKRDAKIIFRDKAGNLVTNKNVKIRQLKHDYGFGSIFSVSQHQRYGGEGSAWDSFFLKHFEWATIGEIQWSTTEPNQGQVNYSQFDVGYNFCKEKGLKIRGHRLFSENGPDNDWIDSISNSALQQAMNARVNSLIRYTAGKIDSLDVCNEMAENDYYKSRLGNSIRTWMFQTVHGIDPECKLFVNEYSIVEESRLIPATNALIQGLLANGAHIDALGAQCHFDPDLGLGTIDPNAILQRLDILAGNGLPIWATEFHCRDADENVRADKLEKFYRTFFSHPSTAGIIMWGFWGAINQHPYGPDAAIVDADWSLNAAGVKYESLMNEWTTKLDTIINGAGEVNFRGFHGLYEIEVSGGQFNSKPQIFSIELLPSSGTADYTIILCPEADLNGDCSVGFEDFAIIANDWTKCTDPGNSVNCIDYAY